MILVLVFAAAYYRVAGLIACFALAMNLTLTLGLMILFSAPSRSRDSPVSC
jgi:SecD/SecF fusion protein